MAKAAHGIAHLRVVEPVSEVVRRCRCRAQGVAPNYHWNRSSAHHIRTADAGHPSRCWRLGASRPPTKPVPLRRAGGVEAQHSPRPRIRRPERQPQRRHSMANALRHQRRR